MVGFCFFVFLEKKGIQRTTAPRRRTRATLCCREFHGRVQENTRRIQSTASVSRRSWQSGGSRVNPTQSQSSVLSEPVFCLHVCHSSVRHHARAATPDNDCTTARTLARSICMYVCMWYVCNQQRVATCFGATSSGALRSNQQRRALEQPAATRFGATCDGEAAHTRHFKPSLRPQQQSPKSSTERFKLHDVPARMHPWTAAKVYRLHVKIQHSHVQGMCQNSMLRCTGFAHLRSGSGRAAIAFKA